ncbi:hypothetical protein PFISCL1PPCAC_5123, partial [Pristionchus fissidentatus]
IFQMRLFIFLFAFLAVSTDAVDVSTVMKKCLNLELTCNQSAIESIFAEEAKKIGRCVEDHANICLRATRFFSTGKTWRN